MTAGHWRPFRHKTPQSGTYVANSHKGIDGGGGLWDNGSVLWVGGPADRAGLVNLRPGRRCPTMPAAGPAA